jgi:hypothetical protein
MKNLVNSEELRPRSTYQLLVQSEEKERSFFENLAYLLLIVATSASIWQFSHQPVTFTGLGLDASKNAIAQHSPSLRS